MVNSALSEGIVGLIEIDAQQATRWELDGWPTAWWPLAGCVHNLSRRTCSAFGQYVTADGEQLERELWIAYRKCSSSCRLSVAVRDR